MVKSEEQPKQDSAASDADKPIEDPSDLGFGKENIREKRSPESSGWKPLRRHRD